MKQICTLTLVVSLLAVAGCSKLGGSNTEDSPIGPSSNYNVAGVWTGTLSRPDGSTVAVRWQVTTETDGGMTGPMTLTYNGASVITTGRGVPGGNDRSGYSIYFSIMGKRGDDPARPNCFVSGNTPTSEAFRAPYNSITTVPFDIGYYSCEGFIDPPAQRTFLTESTRLNLSK